MSNDHIVKSFDEDLNNIDLDEDDIQGTATGVMSLITGIILYSIGYGPVKGFAIILCLGILTSMFTGVFVSKALTNICIRENKSQLFGAKL